MDFKVYSKSWNGSDVVVSHEVEMKQPRGSFLACGLSVITAAEHDVKTPTRHKHGRKQNKECSEAVVKEF